jgi:hypothetical protein
LGDLKLSKPIAWQEKDGKKLPVEVSYKLIDKNRYSFVVAKANPSLPIVIDPILQSTYLGGSNNNEAYALAIHPTTGEVYVAGLTESIDFPNTSGGAQESKSGGDDAFVARLDKDLTQVMQSTYLGGSSRDEARALAIHPTTGEVYVAGYTESANFPKATGGAQKKYGGKGDTFVARLNKDLTQILQSTYMGGKGLDVAYALAIHPTTGEVYVAGYTESASFPKATGGAQEKYGGKGDTFVARLNKDLTQILQSTYLGGKSSDVAYALAIHPTTGEVYVAGLTESSDFPNTTGGAQKVYGGGSWDAFVVRLNSNLTQILQSTYLGGKDTDVAFALAVHPKTGDVYVAGYTLSKNFPNTSGGAQTGHRGGYEDAFVARLNKDLTKILQSTYLGGNSSDIAHTLAIHPTTGEVYVAGETESTNFPEAAGGAQKSKGKKGDAFVARLNSNLTKILRSTYLGGSGNDYATALAISSTGDVYVAGYTLSTDLPKATGGAQATFEGGGFNAFVSRLTADLAAGGSSGVGSSMTAYASSAAGF